MPQTHKRKRSLQDTPVNLGKMSQARLRLSALKEELDGIEETEGELAAIMEHVTAVEDILCTAKKPKLSVSSASVGDLEKIGLLRKRLVFRRDLVTAMAQMTSTGAIKESQRLHERIQEIYERVNIYPGSRMIIDAFLLSLAKIVKIQHPDSPKQSIAILPEMRIGTSEGVMVTNPSTNHEVWLTGTVDYAILQYVDELDNRERLLASGTGRTFAWDIATRFLFLVEAKCLQVSASDYMPEAICQAIALSKVTNQTEVRFCLSNGQDWIFSILKKDGNADKWTCYESIPRSISKTSTTHDICGILQLISEWLEPKPHSALYALVP